MTQTIVTVQFRVDCSGAIGHAESIVKSELDDNRQMFKKWYNQYDDSYGVVSYKIVSDDERAN